MSHTNHAPDPGSAPDEDSVRYDLAGNLLPPRPAQAAPPIPVSVPTPAASYAPPSHARPLPASGVSPHPAPPSRLGLYLGLAAAAAAVAFVLIFGLRALRPVAVTPPKSYQTYTALDNSFSCDGPVGWKKQETGAPAGALATVSYELGPARVRVVSDAAGSLLSESFVSANANLPPEQQKPPVEKLHEMDEKQLADSLTDYQEQPTQKFPSPFGDARVSEWTATGHGGPLHGYRATMLGREREVTVICLAPEQNWTALQPAFQRIVNSARRAAGRLRRDVLRDDLTVRLTNASTCRYNSRVAETGQPAVGM